MEYGEKFDEEKPRWSLFPKGALAKVLAVLEFGAKKYAPDNWKKVDNARERYYNAMMRHIEAWWNGEQNDPETGKHHLAHAVCCALFLMCLTEPNHVSQVGFTAGLPKASGRTDDRNLLLKEDQ